MKKVVFVIALFNLHSCVMNKSIITIKCQLNDSKNSSVELNIPKYKNQQIVITDAEEGIEYIFWYKDSAAVYVSTFKGGATVNYQNIRNWPYAYSKRFSSDSINLQGIDAKGKLWREIKKHELYVGYYRINPNDKLTFDKAIADYVLK